jgi:hypothetical protein
MSIDALIGVVNTSSQKITHSVLSRGIAILRPVLARRLGSSSTTRLGSALFVVITFFTMDGV